MTTAPPSWSNRAVAALGMLAARPWSLFLALLALNAVARPYAGIIHDARLYAAQVLTQIDPASYGDDLFFRYGSQDQFSIFSRVTAPLVDWLGLEAGFFVLYLVFNSLLILGMKRLVEALLEDRLISTLALAFMVAAPLHFGGLKLFHVLEPFVTSRLIANAIIVFALERTVRRRHVSALVLLLLAFVFHPVMTVGGLLIWGACVVWDLLSGKALAVLVVVLGLATTLLLATPALAARLFGTMDEEWRDIILRATPGFFISEWPAADWLNVVLGLGTVSAAAYATWGTGRGRFLTVVSMVSVTALVGDVVAESLPYALLLQGQPYRALWLLRLVQVPCAFWIAARLLDVPRWYGPLGAVLLIGMLGLTTDLPLEKSLGLFVLPIAALRYRGLNDVPLVADWWRRSLLASLALGFVSWAVFMLYLFGSNIASALARMDVLEFVRLLLERMGPIAWLVLFMQCVSWGAEWTKFSAGFQVAVATLALLAQGAFALLAGGPEFRERLTLHGQDIRFVQEYLRKNAVQASPTIYGDLGKLELVWFDLEAKSYFDLWQMSGVLFQQKTALEGQRRARLVARFEMDRLRRLGASEEARILAGRLLGIDSQGARPGVEDFRRLCREEGLDLLVLSHEFPGAAAGNGQVFVYDCRKGKR